MAVEIDYKLMPKIDPAGYSSGDFQTVLEAIFNLGCIIPQ
jgi:hypothetical protein